MIGFQTPLVLIADRRPDLWILDAPLVWEDPVFGRLVAPKGFVTDLASIPRALRNIEFLDPDGLSRRPAVLHDFLYAWRVKGKDFADNFLRASLLSEGATSTSASAFYLAVHWFGGPSWASDAGALSTTSFITIDAYKAWLVSQ